MNCGSLVTRYIVLAVSEFLDTLDEDPEQTKFDNVTICDSCWNCSQREFKSITKYASKVIKLDIFS